MKKTKVLADIFFNSNNEKKIYKILFDIEQSKDIVYHDDYYEIHIDPIMLNVYLSRFISCHESGQLYIGKLDYIHLYHVAVDAIRYQGRKLNDTSYNEYKSDYGECYLDLPVIKRIKHYEVW